MCKNDDQSPFSSRKLQICWINASIVSIRGDILCSFKLNQNSKPDVSWTWREDVEKISNDSGFNDDSVWYAWIHDLVFCVANMAANVFFFSICSCSMSVNYWCNWFNAVSMGGCSIFDDWVIDCCIGGGYSKDWMTGVDANDNDIGPIWSWLWLWLWLWWWL